MVKKIFYFQMKDLWILWWKGEWVDDGVYIESNFKHLIF